MVRLNESASAPMESVDLLKRRFLRQNKEIIRVNSDQSIRIRTLEAEQSRLLSENITLREENIRLNHELTKSRHALALENVGNVRHKLETFAAGLGGLLAELADAHTKLPLPTPLHESARRRSPKNSPSHRVRPADVAGSLMEEGRLTPIVEGKHYPRKTLSPSALGAVEEQNVAMSDSPDLGPPPVVQYDMGDPIKQSPSPGRTRDLSADLREEEPQDLFVNLEKRKKRRSSMFAKDSEKPASIESAMVDRTQDKSSIGGADLQSVAKPIKASGKRKLSMREDDDNRRPADDFEYTKKVLTEDKKSATLAIRGGKPVQTIHHKTSTDFSAKPKQLDSVASTVSLRKALCEKPVNTDPMVSPAKTKSRTNKGSRGDPMKTDPIKADPPSQPNSAASVNNNNNNESLQKQRREDKKLESKITEVYVAPLEPATPAVVDIVSPMDVSAPSTAHGPMSRDTPPPSDLSGRPSRRSRPAVSYAEPKLNHKMRRPGKELVDAVPDDKSKRSSFASASVGPGSEPPSSTTTLLPNWQSITSEAPSPLAPKLIVPAELDSELKTDRKRRMSRASDDTKTAEEQAAARESKIAEIVNISNRRLSRAREAAEARSQAQNADTRAARNKSEQDVFDFVDSSSPEAVATGSLLSKAHRRTSSVPEKSANAGTEHTSVRSSSRRRETMMTANTSEKSKDIEGDESQNEEATAGRGSKMLTRRKSMMV